MKVTKEQVVLKLPTGKLTSVGELDVNTGVFYMFRSKKKHFLRKFGAWGLDLVTFTELRERGLTGINLFEKDSGNTYFVSLNNILDNGFVDLFPPYGEQIFVGAEHWELLGH